MEGKVKDIRLTCYPRMPLGEERRTSVSTDFKFSKFSFNWSLENISSSFFSFSYLIKLVLYKLIELFKKGHKALS